MSCFYVYDITGIDYMDSTSAKETHDHGDTLNEESLFERRFEEGYDIFHEPYVRWLMVHHPEAVKSEWLDKTPSSSGTGSSEQKDITQDKESNEITLNYNTVYGAMNKPRKRPIVGAKFGPTGQTEYISEYLHQAVPLPKEKPKRIRITGARVLTSDEAMRIVQEKEDAKKQKELEKEKRKKEREMKKKQKQKQKQKKGSKTKRTISNKGYTSSEENYLDKCPICKMKWEDDHDQDSEWLECDCKQWLHENCIDYDIYDPYLCPDCVKNQ